MKVFDGHGDILTDIMEKSKKNIDIFENYHYPLYKKGNVIGSVFINYTNPFDVNQKDYFEEITNISLPYFKNNKRYHIVNNSFDLNKFNVLFGIEGLNVVDDINHIDKLYKKGYRLFGLTWNENNKFAHFHESNLGLTNLGKDMIKYANENNIIIDLSHASKQTFLDTYKLTTNPLVVSHSAAKTIYDHTRNIDDEQLDLIKKTNGIIGVYAIPKFLKKDYLNTTIDAIIEHIDYIKNKIGINHISLGLDFCYYLEENETSSNVKHLETIAEVQNLESKLKELNYTKEDIEKIFYKNILRVFNETLN